MTTSNKIGIYVHLPFCAKRCNYCDFYSQTDLNNETIAKYIDAICKEISLWKVVFDEPKIVDSVFIGGGTPSAICAEHIKRLLAHISGEFGIERNAELSIEANPSSLGKEKLKAYKDAGITRLSIGIQSFTDAELKFLGRLHDANMAKEVFYTARDEGFSNINIDLMFGFEKEFEKNALNNLKEAVDLAPEHISFYSLQLEDGTKMFENYLAGNFELPSEETDRNTYKTGVELLKKSGYRHYEISNFAKCGYECRHNLKYWSMQEYIGLGASASSYTNRTRRTNLFSIGEYVSEVQNARKLRDIRLFEEHENSNADDMSDYVITTMRTQRGLSFSNFEKRYGQSFFEAFSEADKILAEYKRREIVKINKKSLKFTLKGINFSNGFLAEFV